MKQRKLNGKQEILVANKISITIVHLKLANLRTMSLIAISMSLKPIVFITI